MVFVFRAYDQQELDRQLNARATVPDIAPFLAAYAEKTAHMRANLPCKIGVQYGPSPAERLDLYLPERNATPAPVFIYLHGGYWRLLDAADSGFMAETFTKAGAIVVAVNYALAPSVSLAEIVRQCRAALAWVYHEIGAWGGDPARLHISGSSAGGHLVGMMLAPGWHADYAVPETIVHSASPLSGLFDLVPVQLSHVNAWLHLSQDEARALSPIVHLPRSKVPMVVAYAPNETEEFKRQSEIYAAACAALGCAVTIIIEPQTNHFDLPLAFMDARRALTRGVMRLMGL